METIFFFFKGLEQIDYLPTSLSPSTIPMRVQRVREPGLYLKPLDIDIIL